MKSANRNRHFMERRIENKVSMTAKMTCVSRAVSYYERSSYYKSNDNLTPLIIPKFINFLIKRKIFRELYKKYVPAGIYEYVIARTKYIDEIFENLPEYIEQVLIFGAGFDTRLVRFQEKLKHLFTFELDSLLTQNAKIKKYSAVKINLPANLKLISIDFDKEALSGKLQKSGFQKNKASLFVLEGLTMYLGPDSVDKLFGVLQDYSGENSIIVFDYVYASVLRQENLYDGEKDIWKTVAKAGEKWNFGIERGKAREFLSKYDFQIIDESDAIKLKEKYFGNQNIYINETHCLVTAKKR
jgi:methyltransferase (TIGR00027 family)